MSGSTHVKLPKELDHPLKGLINIKNDDNKCFLWCHVRHLHCEGVKLSRITKKDREIAEGLSYSGVDFPVLKKDYSKISLMNEININVFCYEDKVVFPVYLFDHSLNDNMDLLLISNQDVNIKDSNRLMFKKICLQCFSSEKVLKEHGRVCLVINSGQNVKLEKGFIEYKSYFKQILAPFKIHADFECLLKGCDSGVNNNCFSYTSKYQDHISCSFVYKVVCVDDKYSKNVALYRGQNAVYKLIQYIFKEYDYCRNVMKKHFNKNLVMTAKEEEEFERSNICWISGGLIET